MNTRDGGLAFPGKLPMQNTITDESRDFVFFGGMSLRDYFAAKALQGICASSPTVGWTDAKISEDAYALADAMLAAREATP